MKHYLSPKRILSIVLWLVSVHSLFVGTGMMLLPSSFMSLLGFTICNECFFRFQGGVFHIIMSIAYGMGAYNIEKFTGLIILAIIAKFTATIFLFSYYFFAIKGWVILFSGIGDFLMGAAIFLSLSYYKKNRLLN